MTTTLTFRMEKEQREKLRKRAAALGKSESELLREILDRELDERPLSERIGHLAGSISLPRDKGDEWAKHIRKQNWRT